MLYTPKKGHFVIPHKLARVVIGTNGRIIMLVKELAKVEIITPNKPEKNVSNVSAKFIIISNDCTPMTWPIIYESVRNLLGYIAILQLQKSPYDHTKDIDIIVKENELSDELPSMAKLAQRILTFTSVSSRAEDELHNIHQNYKNAEFDVMMIHMRTLSKEELEWLNGTTQRRMLGLKYDSNTFETISLTYANFNGQDESNNNRWFQPNGVEGRYDSVMDKLKSTQSSFGISESYCMETYTNHY